MIKWYFQTTCYIYISISYIYQFNNNFTGIEYLKSNKLYNKSNKNSFTKLIIFLEIFLL